MNNEAGWGLFRRRVGLGILLLTALLAALGAPESVLFFGSSRWFGALAVAGVGGIWILSPPEEGRASRVDTWLSHAKLGGDLVVGLFGFSLCWLLRDNSRSGDFKRIVFDIREGVEFLEAEPLSPWMMARLGELTKFAGEPSVASLQFTLCVWGALGVILLRRLAVELAGERESLTPWVFAVLLASGSNSLLVAHVETYTFSGVCMLATFLASARYLRGRAPFAPVQLAFALACAFHMQMLVLAPGVVLMSLWVRDHREMRSRHLLGWLLVVGFLVGLQKICELNPPPYPQHFGGGDGSMFVPTAEWFGRAHLLGVFNEAFLIAPVSLGVVVAFGVGFSPAHLRARPDADASASA